MRGKAFSKCTYLALLEETPFLALLRLRTLLVVAPLDGISHGRHFGGVVVYSRVDGAEHLRSTFREI